MSNELESTLELIWKRFWSQSAFKFQIQDLLHIFHKEVRGGLESRTLTTYLLSREDMSTKFDFTKSALSESFTQDVVPDSICIMLSWIGVDVSMWGMVMPTSWNIRCVTTCLICWMWSLLVWWANMIGGPLSIWWIPLSICRVCVAIVAMMVVRWIRRFWTLLIVMSVIIRLRLTSCPTIDSLIPMGRGTCLILRYLHF